MITPSMVRNERILLANRLSNRDAAPLREVELGSPTPSTGGGGQGAPPESCVAGATGLAATIGSRAGNTGCHNGLSDTGRDTAAGPFARADRH